MKRPRCTNCKHKMKGHKRSKCHKNMTLILPDNSCYTGSAYNNTPDGKGIQKMQSTKLNESISTDNKNGTIFSEEKQMDNPDNKEITGAIKSQLKNTDQVKEKIIKSPMLKTEHNQENEIKNFQDLIDLANKEKEMELRFDLERNVRLVSFNNGKIDISFNEKLNKSFIKNLTEKLLAWTGDRWIISLSKNIGSKTVYEQEMEHKSNNLKAEQSNEIVKKLISTFSDAKLVEIKKDDNA